MKSDSLGPDFVVLTDEAKFPLKPKSNFPEQALKDLPLISRSYH